MSSFVNPNYPTRHEGASRVSNAVETIQSAGKRVGNARGLAAMLLAGAVSALVVVADQVVSSWADGQLLVAWIALWAVIFAAIALFSDVMRGWTTQFAGAIDNWSAHSKQRAQDAQLWAAASADPRLMSELQAAHLRAEREAEAAGEAAPAWPFGRPGAMDLQHYKPF